MDLLEHVKHMFITQLQLHFDLKKKLSYVLHHLVLVLFYLMVDELHIQLSNFQTKLMKIQYALLIKHHYKKIFFENVH